MNDTGLIYCLTRTCAGVSGSASLKGSHQPVSTSISSDEEITLDAQKQKQPLSQITIDNRTSLWSTPFSFSIFWRLFEKISTTILAPESKKEEEKNEEKSVLASSPIADHKQKKDAN